MLIFLSFFCEPFKDMEMDSPPSDNVTGIRICGQQHLDQQHGWVELMALSKVRR
jgi:hypothetical protein